MENLEYYSRSLKEAYAALADGLCSTFQFRQALQEYADKTGRGPSLLGIPGDTSAWDEPTRKLKVPHIADIVYLTGSAKRGMYLRLPEYEGGDYESF